MSTPIEHIADLLSQDLQITYYPNQNRRFCCRFRDGEVMVGVMLASVSGNGRTPEEALRNYASAIAGKKMAFSAMSPARVDFTMPQDLV